MPENEIPKNVVDIIGDERYTITKIGKYKGNTAFQAFIEGAKTGFPIVVLYGSDGSVQKIESFNALDIINALS